MMWSRVPKVRSGMRTLSFSSLSIWKACGVVTSWMRCRPTRSWVWPDGSVRTVCASHTLSSSVRAIQESSVAYHTLTVAKFDGGLTRSQSVYLVALYGATAVLMFFLRPHVRELPLPWLEAIGAACAFTAMAAAALLFGVVALAKTLG